MMAIITVPLPPTLYYDILLTREIDELVFNGPLQHE